MSEQLITNSEYAGKLKTILELRGEPVAVKLVKEGENFPEMKVSQAENISHCQAVFRAVKGESFCLTTEMENCHVGTSVLGMTSTPDKVSTGEFHAGIGIHDSVEAAGMMISQRVFVPYKTVGEVVCPLKDADFTPDVVILMDLPERIYWIVALMSAEKGGRATFSTAPFQCACEDITAIPIVTGSPNISLGCFGCRKRTDMSKDEVACGIPYVLMPSYMSRLEKYKAGVMAKARRD
jgi:Uncharacterized protein conserved in archaea